MRNRPKIRNRRRAATIVEFALIVPILVALLLGIIEFGWLIKNHLAIANATREGARAAAVGRSTVDIQTRIASMAQPLRVTAPDGSIVMNYSIDNGASYLAWPPDTVTGKNGVLSGNLVKITVNSRHRPLTGFFPFLNNRDLTTNVTMRRES